MASRDTFWENGDIYVEEPKILINAHRGELGKNELIINDIYNTLKTSVSVHRKNISVYNIMSLSMIKKNNTFHRIKHQFFYHFMSNRYSRQQQSGTTDTAT